VNGLAAPLLAVASLPAYQQINFVVPDIGYASTAEVIVSNNGVASLPVRASVFLAQPGVFTTDAVHAAAQHGSDYSAISAMHPAQRGEQIIVYATGLGPVQPPVLAGYPAPATPLSVTWIPPFVQVGGSQAKVLFSGLAPGFSGLYQLNVIIPASVSPGELDLVVSIGDESSKTTKLFVQ
jgi:adhesin/invasin